MKQTSVLSATQDWEMQGVWNDTLGNSADRPAKPRGNLWASELGKPNIELFLKMKGVESSNPPNMRSKKKFAAGRLIEWIVQVMLNRAGILKSTQDWVSHQYPGLLEVTGKLDFIAGGVPDYEKWEKWEALMRELEMPEDFFTVNHALREHFSKKYPEGLAETILEIKSCSSFAMNAMEKTKKSSKNHRMQDYHYLKAKGVEQGRVVYVCRDDLRMFESPVKLSNKKVEAEYRGAIEEITGYFKKFENTPLEKFIVFEEKKPVAFMPMEGMPPLEKNIIWDEDYGKFARNWGVEYSNYLTLLYGFADQMMFEDAVMPTVGRWNRVMSRLAVARVRTAWLGEQGLQEAQIQKEKVEGKKGYVQFVMKGEEKIVLPDDIQKGYDITEKNVAVLKEIADAGFNPNELAEKFAGTEEEEETV